MQPSIHQVCNGVKEAARLFDRLNVQNYVNTGVWSSCRPKSVHSMVNINVLAILLPSWSAMTIDKLDVPSEIIVFRTEPFRNAKSNKLRDPRHIVIRKPAVDMRMLVMGTVCNFASLLLFRSGQCNPERAGTIEWRT
jgi:hypothetical protein